MYVYADNAATTPLSPGALAAMMPYLTESFGNPGGIHRVAKKTKTAIEGARETIAALLGARPSEIFFTSGGSESDTWALRGCAEAWYTDHADIPFTIVTSSIEHHAVLHACTQLEQKGCRIVVLPVDTQGHVLAETLKDALDSLDFVPGSGLVSIMLANNEVGTIQDIAALSKIAHEHDLSFHTDAVQAAGHIPINARDLDVDMLSISAHKFHGPKGVGALYIKHGTPICPLIPGGGQQNGMRGGTENVAGIVGMASALKECVETLPQTMPRVISARKQLTEAVLASCPDVTPTGDASDAGRLSSIASFICPDVDAQLLITILDEDGIAAATGSACNVGSTEPSHVITALGYTDERLNQGTLRLSLADNITAEELAYLCGHVPACIKRAKQVSGTSLPTLFA